MKLKLPVLFCLSLVLWQQEVGASLTSLFRRVRAEKSLIQQFLDKLQSEQPPQLCDILYRAASSSSQEEEDCEFCEVNLSTGL